MPKGETRAERRIITALVADVVESTRHVSSLDPDDVQEFLDKCFDRVSAAVTSENGTVITFTGDGAIAIFGWPLAIERHALQACCAAWKIQNPDAESRELVGPDGRRIRFRVGVYSGLAGLRELELESGSRLDAIGGAIHLAASLQKAASPGQILIAGETVRLCGQGLDVKPRESERADGNGAIYELRGAPKLEPAIERFRRYRTPIIGRRRIRSKLSELLSVDRSKTVCAALIGESGIGKSRLASALLDEAESAGIKTVTFYGDAKMQTTAFAAIKGLIRAAIKDSDGAVSAICDQIIEEMRLPPTVAGFLKELVLPTQTPAENPSSQVPQVRMAQTLALFLARAAALNRTLIILEDLQLIDQESLSGLVWLSRYTSVAPLALLLTGRPEALSLVKRFDAEVIPVEPMEPQEMRELALVLRSDGRVDELVLNRVIERAGGVPFILEEFMLALGADEDVSKSLPQSIESVIHSRLGRLSVNARRLAQLLSMLGDEVEFGVAQGVYGGALGSMNAHLNELEEFAFIHPRGGDTIRFRHSIIAEACADTVPRAERTRLHRAAIESVSAFHWDITGQFERLAHHAEGAEDDIRAVDYYLQALKVARKNSANDSLLAILDSSMACCERLGDTASDRFVDLVLGSFDSMQQRGDLERMRKYLPRAAELAAADPSSKKACVAKCHQGLMHWYNANYQEGLELMKVTVEEAERHASVPLECNARFTLSLFHHALGDVARSIKLQLDLCTRLSGNLAQAKLGSTGVLGALTRAYLCYCYLEVGEFDEGRKNAEIAASIAQHTQEPYSEAVALLALGRSQLLREMNEAAINSLRRSKNIVNENRYGPVNASVTGFLCLALARAGRVEEGIETAEAYIRERGNEPGSGYEPYYLHAGYGEALIAAGRVDKGLASIEDAIDFARSINCPTVLVQGYGLRGRMLEATGRDTPLISESFAAEKVLCERHGLHAWRPEK